VNSFLLTLTAVLIVVLGALFAAPLFIDWNDYRPVFETQAAKLLGRAVKVGGKVHLVLLPAPELRFDDVKVADQDGRFDQPLLEARSIEAWLNIGALLGGGVEARNITISDPVLRLALRQDGSSNWSDVGRPGEALPFVPKEVLLDEVSVTGGRIEVMRPGQPSLVIAGVEGEASAGSLSGPYKVSATYDFAGRHQELRFSTSASDADGLFRLKSALRDPDRSTTYLLEGDVTGLRQKPSYAGNLIIRIAPNLPAVQQTAEPQAAGPQAGQQAAEPPTPAAGPQAGDEALTPETNLSAFELKGEVKATPDRAELPSFELTLHAKGRSQMLKGKLALDFGEHPKAAGELSARWIDVDTLLAVGAKTEPQAELSAAEALSAVAEKLLAEAASVGEGALLINLDQASLGGDLIGDIDLALASRDGAVTIEHLKAELPGETRLEASGRLSRAKGAPVFEGPLKLEGSKLRTLTRWAAGDREMSGQASVGAFALSAKATIGGGNLDLNDASGELSGTKFSGALHYHGREQRLIDLALDSDRLDLREVLGDSAAWRSWLPASTATKDAASGAAPNLLTSLRDDEADVTLRVGELLLPNIPPGKLDAKFTLAKDVLDVERLDFAATGAIALNGKGHIERLSDAPVGQVDFALQAATADGLRVAAELLGMTESVTKSKQLASLAPLDLQVGLTAVRDGNATKASVQVKGKAGGADVSAIAKAIGEPAKLADAEIDIDGTVAGDRPQALLSLLVPGLMPERLALAGAEQGKLTLKAHGVPNANVTGRAELVTASLQAAFDGRGSLKPDGVALSGQASAKTSNAALALVLMGLDASPSDSGVPLDLHADMAKAAQSIDLNSVAGQIAGQTVRGSAHFDLSGDKTRFNVQANVASASLPSLLGPLVAWQRTPTTEQLLGAIGNGASDVWPSRGFALQPLERAEGEIRLDAKRLALGAPFQLEDAVLLARLDKAGLSLTDLKGRLFGGAFAASATLSPQGAGAELKAHAELTSGQLDQLSQSVAGRILAKGPFALTVNVSGEGLSPPGLVAGLSGEGTLTLDPGVVQALSPEPLRRMAIDAAKTKKIKVDKDQIAAQARSLRDKLTRGTYSYAAAKLAFEVKNGTLKFEPATLASKGAETTINGYVELASLRLDSEWVMRLDGSRDADVPPVSLVFAGPLSDAGAITPAIDTASIESFLTVRRMQEDVERLETLDVSGRNQAPADAEPSSADAPPEAKRSSDATPSAEPPAEAERPAETPVETKRSSVAKPSADIPAVAKRPAEAPVEAKRSNVAKSSAEAPAEAKRQSVAAPKAAASAKAPPVSAAAPPEPRAADLDAGTQGAPPQPEPALPWSQGPANPAPDQRPAPAATAPEQPAPVTAVGDDVGAPAAPAPRASKGPRAPSRPPQTPDDWKKGVGIFSGG